MDYYKSRRIFGRHDLQDDVEELVKQWMRLRQLEEDRRRQITASNQEMLRRWQPEESRPKEDRELVLEQVERTVSILKMSTELGSINNDAFARCTAEFKEAKRKKGSEKVLALGALQSEISQIIEIELPKRDLVLDSLDREARILNDLIGRLLGAQD